jgi:hypothetical protein
VQEVPPEPAGMADLRGSGGWPSAARRAWFWAVFVAALAADLVSWLIW